MAQGELSNGDGGVQDDKDAGADKREHQRVRAVKLVQYKHFDPDFLAEQLVDDLGMGKTLNISTGGLNFVCSAPLPTSWGLHIDLVLEDDEILQVTGRIVHVEEVSDDRYRVGVKFTKLTDELRERLDALIATRANGVVGLS